MDDLNAKQQCQDVLWDDTLLVKAYDNSLKLAREELARRIAISTSKDANKDLSICHGATQGSNEINHLDQAGIEVLKTKNEYNVGDYVRATYEDGIDYEAKILAIDESSGTCILKYIGYDNEQEMPLDNLIPSWGKKARRLQFGKAKLDDTEKPLNLDDMSSKTFKKRTKTNNIITIPPPPPMPPMLSAGQDCEDSEHLSAMLMSWYMSGYYTGVYQGSQMAKSTSKNKKK